MIDQGAEVVAEPVKTQDGGVGGPGKRGVGGGQSQVVQL